MESDIERLYHFTNEESLKGILETKEFWVSFCEEDHRFLNEADVFKCFDFGVDEIIVKNIVAYPIVCFCDIPLERIKVHTITYGKFGIGMKREWAKKHNISPVQYVSEESLTARLWLNILSQINIMQFIKKEYKGFEESFFNDLIHLASYIKPYRNIESIFYNEREWRYYPPSDPWGESKRRFLIKNEEIDEISEYKNKNGSKKSDYKLPFNYEDIDCLIVPDEENKQKFIKILKELKIKGVNVNIRK